MLALPPQSSKASPETMVKLVTTSPSTASSKGVSTLPLPSTTPSKLGVKGKLGSLRDQAGSALRRFGAVFVREVFVYLLRRVQILFSWLTPPVVALGVLCGLGFGLVGYALNSGLVTRYLQALASMGLPGHALVILSFIPVSMPFIMGYTPLTFATGYMYGVQQGILTSSLGAMLGSAVSFFLIRATCRESLRARLNHDARFRGFMSAVEFHGFKVVVLMRCVPIPFGLQNSLFAVSPIGWFKYLVASFLGLLPAQIMGNYFGSTLHGFADILSGRYEVSGVQAYMIYAQLFVTAFVFAFLLYLGKRALSYTHVHADDAGESGADADGGNGLIYMLPEKLRHSMPSIATETEACIPADIEVNLHTCRPVN